MEYHSYERDLAELCRDNSDVKFIVDVNDPNRAVVPSFPGYLSFLVCEEAGIGNDGRANQFFLIAFSLLLEAAKKEQQLDNLIAEWTERIKAAN